MASPSCITLCPAPDGTMGEIVLDDVQAIDPPLAIADVNISTRRSPKGVGLSPEEVQRIFAAISARPVAPLPSYIPTGDDMRERIARQLAARRGQPEFRGKAIVRYGPQCLVSGCTLLEIVEAAHIMPYRSQNDNHPENALLLRSDLHTMFNLDLLGIHPERLTVKLHPHAVAAGYALFDGVRLACHDGSRPSQQALSIRWGQFQRILNR